MTIDVKTQAEIDAEVALEDHLNRKAGIYPETDEDNYDNRR